MVGEHRRLRAKCKMQRKQINIYMTVKHRHFKFCVQYDKLCDTSVQGISPSFNATNFSSNRI